MHLGQHDFIETMASQVHTDIAPVSEFAIERDEVAEFLGNLVHHDSCGSALGPKQSSEKHSGLSANAHKHPR